MALEAYRLRKLVILSPVTTVRGAARAMGRHRVGAVLVGERGYVEGVVTDRDLALAVVGDAADCKRTTVDQIMSDTLVSVEIAGNVADVVRAMRRYACRRIPLTERGKVVGIVTLDDLILDRAISLEDAACVLGAELELPALFGRGELAVDTSHGEPRGWLRHERGAERVFLRMVNAVQDRAGLTTRARAAQGLAIVLGGICRRMPPLAAQHLLAQMPSYVRQALERDAAATDRTVSPAQLIARLGSELSVSGGRAEAILTAIGEVVTESIWRGEVLSLRSRLPTEFSDLFPERARLSG